MIFDKSDDNCVLLTFIIVNLKMEALTSESLFSWKQILDEHVELI